jgi:hypothetical protein
MAGGLDPPPPPSPRASPLFLVGFPRSGTTLLDTLLMADPDVAVLEEEPFIVEAEAALGGVAASTRRARHRWPRPAMPILPGRCAVR